MISIGISIKRTSSCFIWTVLGLLLCGVTVFTQGCSGPALKPWHNEKLTEEFTTEMAEEIPTFDDYRELEDRLFTQLQEKVYARTEIGPEYMLVRYSAGSAADPQHREPNWNRSFEFAADKPVGGVLLLHGMSDSPYSLRALGQTLNQRNFWVVGLRLPGHGTAPLNLAWPQGVISLSHVALPFPPDDPLYGQAPPAKRISSSSAGWPFRVNGTCSKSPTAFWCD